MEDTQAKVFIILVNYGQAELTLKCIESINRSNDISPTVIVVDNCSPDNSYDILKNKLDSNTILLKSEENNGFAAGNNIGIRYAIENGANYIMLLNNDTEIDPDMIDILLRYTDEKTVTAPKMYYFDKPDTIWFAGGRYLRFTGRFVHIGENETDSNKFNNITECDFLTGCCMMFKTESIKKVGYLPEEYFMYYEDVDYSLNLRRNGIRLLMIPEAKLWHKVGSSSGGEKSKTAIYYGNRNRLYLLKKYKFNLFVRIEALLSRFILFCKGSLNNSIERYIIYSICDFFFEKMGKTLLTSNSISISTYSIILVLFCKEMQQKL